MHKIFTALLFLCTTISFSQNVTLKGKATYTDDTPLESATNSRELFEEGLHIGIRPHLER